ncbi:MAG: hypothetical protein R3277_02870 [Brumimicrobium sp.]|nr:hypothetical protein [Brumimicrobium sp.]
MEKIKMIFFTIFFASCSLTGQTQEVLRTGLIRAQLTLSPGTFLNTDESLVYLHGTLEAYTDSKISLTGEGFLQVGQLGSEQSSISQNHSVFFGFHYHFTRSNHDLYMGIQPGLSFTRLNPQEETMEAQTGYNPVFSAAVGYNYYVGRFFHFFVQSRLILGNHMVDRPYNLAELRLSAGLGFNLNVLR